MQFISDNNKKGVHTNIHIPLYIFSICFIVSCVFFYKSNHGFGNWVTVVMSGYVDIQKVTNSTITRENQTLWLGIIARRECQRQVRMEEHFAFFVFHSSVVSSMANSLFIYLFWCKQVHPIFSTTLSKRKNNYNINI